jgi:hypothetical protein
MRLADAFVRLFLGLFLLLVAAGIAACATGGGR